MLNRIMYALDLLEGFCNMHTTSGGLHHGSKSVQSALELFHARPLDVLQLMEFTCLCKLALLLLSITDLFRILGAHKMAHLFF
jgi:hypothetical protein